MASKLSRIAMGKAQSPNRRRSRRWTAKLLLLCTSLALGVLVIEVVLRAIEPDTSLHMHRENPAGTGSYRLIPNLSLTANFQGQPIEIKTNSHGMRWREVSKDKPAGVKRIAVLGDSFTFGDWASSIDHTFVSVFEQHLDHQKFEVLNFGTVGYGFADFELQLREQVSDFNVDYVVIVSFNGNDWKDTSFGVNRFKVVEGAIVPKEVGPREINDWWLGKWAPYARHSAILRYLRGAVLRLETEVGADVEVVDCSKLNFDHFKAATYWCQSPYPEKARQAIEEGQQVLTRIGQFCDDHGIQLLTVALPIREQVYAREPVGENFDTRYPQLYLEEFSAGRGVPYLDMLPLLREANRSEPQQFYAPKNVHFNDAGHAFAGKAMAEFFSRHCGSSSLAKVARRERL